MAEQKKIEAPERIEDLADRHDPISIHMLNYSRIFAVRPRLENLLSALKHGIVSPPLAKKIERGLDKKMFDLPPYAGSPVDRQLDPNIYADTYSRQPVRPRGYSLDKLKEAFRKQATGGPYLPVILFSKPSFQSSSSDKRVQPRFFVGVVLPDQNRRERQKWLEGIKKTRPVPVYGQSGKLIWSPEWKEK